MNEKVAKALSYVDEKYVSEAARRKKKKYHFIAAIAALLALVLLLNIPGIPLAISAKAVSIASESRKMERPNINSDKFDLWYEENELRKSLVKNAAKPIADFSAACSKEILAGVDTENRVWSPVNTYIALAAVTELAGGDTRQQIIDFLGVADLNTLRDQISAVWEQIYQNNGKEISVLANSLWLDTEIDYHQEAMDNLAYHYYASVYQGDLGSDQINRDLANWLQNQTGGLLSDRTGEVSLSNDSIMALASTIYFQSQWNSKFDSRNNTQATFHAIDGDITRTFMNKKEVGMMYYWAENYSAVVMHLATGSSMWFILPDEGKTVDDVLQHGEYMAMITGSDGFSRENQKHLKVNLSVPKFDIASSVDLKPALKEMGLKEIFEPYGNDFSTSVASELPVFLNSINQDTRVTIDEDGVTAASYIILDFGAGSGPPPDEVIDFVLDRPFLFAIESQSIPLFIGAVNNP